MNIEKNTTVMIKYTLKDSDGVVLESTEGVGGVSYLHGRGLMIPELEKALEGKGPGESFAVSLKAADAYGERDDELVIEVPRGDFQDPETIEIGENIQIRDGSTGDPESGGVMTVVGISDDHITLDGNHPYSGKDVVFNISVLEIRETTQEDLDALFHHHHDCDHKHSGGCCGGEGGHREDGCCGGKGSGGCCG